jgi:hypothetical protein
MIHPPSDLPKTRVGSLVIVEASKLINALGITRQTLWNWRRAGKIPVGSRYRNRVVFTIEEARTIQSFAHYLEPVALSAPSNQLKLPLK